MSKIALEMLADIEKETVDFGPNYDDSLKEPIVITSKFPNLLVNGSSGIAVGMATNIPPHNLGEVIDGIIAIMDDPNITIDELMDYIKGPDFPTAGLIMGRSGIRAAYQTGRGRIMMRARAVIEEKGTHQQIVVTEIPYQVNKAKLVEKIGELMRDKRIDGIAKVRDESDREGMRIVIEVRRDANASVILNQLYKYTQMQESFCANMIALVNKTEPKLLNLREMLDHYIEFQRDVLMRKTRFELRKAMDREHILQGLCIAVDNIDEVIETIRSSKGGVADAKLELMERFSLSDAQAQAIVDMRLGRLSGLERQKLHDELNEVCEQIKYYNELLGDEELANSVLKEDFLRVKEKYGDERRSEIVAAVDEIEDEDLIEEEDVVITFTHLGYAKRMPIDTYRSQHRGGRGINAQSMRDEDFVEDLITTSTHDNILFFTNKGRMFRLKGYQIPEAGRQAKGTAIVNLLELAPDEHVSATIKLREFSEDKFLTFITRNGTVKRSPLAEYDTTRKSGFRAISLDEGDEVVRVELTDGECDILIATANGMAIRFGENDVRIMGRMARGVRGIRLVDDDFVVGVSVAREGSKMLVVSENGYGKKTELNEYNTQNRGGKGVLTYRITEQTGKIAGMKTVTDDDDLMLITDAGVIIRLHADGISTYSRVTKGVRLMRLDDGVKIVSLAVTERENEEAEEAEAAETQNEDNAQNAEAAETADNAQTPEDAE